MPCRVGDGPLPRRLWCSAAPVQLCRADHSTNPPNQAPERQVARQGCIHAAKRDHARGRAALGTHTTHHTPQAPRPLPQFANSIQRMRSRRRGQRIQPTGDRGSMRTVGCLPRAAPGGHCYGGSRHGWDGARGRVGRVPKQRQGVEPLDGAQQGVMVIGESRRARRPGRRRRRRPWRPDRRPARRRCPGGLRLRRTSRSAECPAMRGRR